MEEKSTPISDGITGTSGVKFVLHQRHDHKSIHKDEGKHHLFMRDTNAGLTMSRCILGLITACLCVSMFL